MTGHWLVDHPGQAPEDRRGYDTREEADHAAWKLEARAVKNVVVWFCTGDEQKVLTREAS